jgi:hypothetical protein
MSQNYHPLKHSSTDILPKPQAFNVKKINNEETTEASKKSIPMQNKRTTGTGRPENEMTINKHDPNKVHGGNRSSISSNTNEQNQNRKNKGKKDKSILGEIIVPKTYLSDTENPTYPGGVIPLKSNLIYASVELELNSSSLDSEKIVNMIPSRRISKIKKQHTMDEDEMGRNFKNHSSFELMKNIIKQETKAPDQIVATNIYINFKFLEFTTAYFTLLCKLNIIIAIITAIFYFEIDVNPLFTEFTENQQYRIQRGKTIGILIINFSNFLYGNLILI